jgi:hypothetical protein
MGIIILKKYLPFPINKNGEEMGRACGTYGGGERCAQGVGGEA